MKTYIATVQMVVTADTEQKAKEGIKDMLFLDLPRFDRDMFLLRCDIGEVKPEPEPEVKPEPEPPTMDLIVQLGAAFAKTRAALDKASGVEVHLGRRVIAIAGGTCGDCVLSYPKCDSIPCTSVGRDDGLSVHFKDAP